MGSNTLLNREADRERRRLAGSFEVVLLAAEARFKNAKLFVKASPFCILDCIRVRAYIVFMSTIQFAWDESKNRANQRKHGISFEEAQTAFLDEHASLYYDPDHSEDEDRFLLLGLSAKLRVLIVCHCFRESSKVIRIISARKANKFEQTSYRG